MVEAGNGGNGSLAMTSSSITQPVASLKNLTVGVGGMRRVSPYPMLPVPEALAMVLSHAKECITTGRRVPLSEATGCVIEEDVIAKEPLPPFPASTMDGYAVCAEDFSKSGVELNVIGEVMAGRVADFKVVPGTCARITTGAPIPPGADAVIKVELTELLPEKNTAGQQVVRFLSTTEKGKCIRPVGSDIAEGQQVVNAGTMLGPTEIGLIATVGVCEVVVHNMPTIAVLSTGDELVELTEPISGGQIRDSNRPMLISAIQHYGKGKWKVVDLGIARDTEKEIDAKVCEAISKADVLLTSGGVSMGELDLIQPVLLRYGKIHFGRLLMKPGKPLTFATIETPAPEGSGAAPRKTLVFGLPGNPVSSLVTFQLVALPCLRQMAGWRNPHLRRIKAMLRDPVALDPERPEYHRCALTWSDENNIFIAHSTGAQGSSRLLSMRSADALLLLPQAEGTLDRNTIVDVVLMGPLDNTI
eukprot:TRINITY_DN4037_c0_g1_i1.p1 TRINITY_DN4037_c0_g1~~TRINITY_DN4037_c0_g1_i1.p1  ORF type:complete len:473 (-),score=58.19 TRINITY_DN4037_c0_g1_i1:17-1435(-)